MPPEPITQRVARLEEQVETLTREVMSLRARAHDHAQHIHVLVNREKSRTSLWVAVVGAIAGIGSAALSLLR